MLPFQPFLADGLIEILAKGIPVILFVLWLIGQAVAEKQKQAKKAAPRPPRQAAAQPQPRPKAQAATTEIEDEIDAFLRRAAEKKGQPQPNPQARREETVILLPQKEEARKARAAAAQRERAPSAQQPLSRPLSQRSGGAQEAPRRQLVAKPTVAPQAPRPAVMTYQESISGPLSTPLSQRQSHLGEEVALADDKLEAHLHQVFDHQLGRLQHLETGTAREASGSPIARSVVELLQNPRGIQQMVVINEILRRPEI